MKSKEVVSRILHRLFETTSIDKIKEPKLRRIFYSWQQACKRILPLGPFEGGNSVEIFHEGDAAFKSMRAAIMHARKKVWFETYIFKTDDLGVLIRDALVDAAKRGCEVVLIYDHFGSGSLGRFFEPLRAVGATALAFNPIWPWRRKGPLLLRNHRKILVVDDEIGFCGGMNVGMEYAGKELGNSRFRDSHIKIVGPSVIGLSELFLGAYQETTGKNFGLLQPKIQTNQEHDVFAQILSANSARSIRAIQSSMEEALSRAIQYCYLTTPYFLPYAPLKKAMIKAAKRGVDVRILTTGVSDIPVMRAASHHVYGQFLEVGIRIFEMHGQTLHAKIATIDGVYGTIGSFNLNHWSDRRNLEVSTCLWDREISEGLKKQFFVDLESSDEITMIHWNNRSWFARLRHFLAYQLVRL